jgi:hypothetical protein
MDDYSRYMFSPYSYLTSEQRKYFAEVQKRAQEKKREEFLKDYIAAFDVSTSTAITNLVASSTGYEKFAENEMTNIFQERKEGKVNMPKEVFCKDCKHRTMGDKCTKSKNKKNPITAEDMSHSYGNCYMINAWLNCGEFENKTVTVHLNRQGKHMATYYEVEDVSLVYDYDRYYKATISFSTSTMKMKLDNPRADRSTLGLVIVECDGITY